MKICIWFNLTSRPWGGSNSFLSALAGELRKRGHTITHRPRLSDDIVLLNSWSRGAGRYLDDKQAHKIRIYGSASPLAAIIARIQKRTASGTPIVHRADGVAQLYGRKNPRYDTIQFQIAKIANHVIFQSCYSQESFAQFGVVPTKWQIVHNGVDGRRFYPNPEKSHPPATLRMLAVSWSSNPMKGFAWLPKLADLPGVKVSFIGNWCPTVSPGKVQCLGVKVADEIAALMRQSDMLVHPAENENCANVILEALACGLPVLYRDSGGNKELAGEYGLPLEDPIHEVVDTFRSRYIDLKQKTLADHDKFLIASRAKQYLHIFKQTIEGAK